MKTFGEKVKELRKKAEKKYNQTYIANQMGMTQKKLSNIEVGSTKPNIDDIIAICKYFDVSADYLLGLTEDRTPTKVIHITGDGNITIDGSMTGNITVTGGEK